MEDYNKIIESLGVKFASARKIEILQPVTVESFYDVSNTLVLLNEGSITFEGETTESIAAGDMIMIPSGRPIDIMYGKGEARLSHDDLATHRDKYFSSDMETPQGDNFTIIGFEAKVFDSVNFFQSLDIPAFAIKGNKHLASIIEDLIGESRGDRSGKERMMKIKTDEIVVELMRHVLENQLFVEQLATNATYFKDPRLLDIFAYIKENLQGDLSNKVLSNVANVSEDYVGQYFKMLTGINPQDYIEYQRMERAVTLLRTSKRSIREIGKDVGYKDTAYFCRRFKMMFGIPAGKMRKRESLMNF